MTLVEYCPVCQSVRDKSERFCWHCSTDLMRFDTTCYECGCELRTGHRTPRDWKEIAEELRELRLG